MESILHIEPIVRKVTPPLTIGSTDVILYGESKPDPDADDVGFIPAISSGIGSPLQSIDCGSSLEYIPLVKTIEYMPDDTRRTPHIFTETIHYQYDKYLIPLRTEIMNGPSSGMILSHLPSLNFVRKELSGYAIGVQSYRPEVIGQLLEHDHFFSSNKNHPAKEWIEDELIYKLQHSPIADVEYSTENICGIIQKFMSAVRGTTYEFGIDDAKKMINTISLEKETVPSRYFSQDVIVKPLADFRRAMVRHPHDFRTAKMLPINNLPKIEINPLNFYSHFVVVEHLPLTDCNVDVIVGVTNNVLKVYDNVVVNRFGVFHAVADRWPIYTPIELIEGILNEEFLKRLINDFLMFHPGIDQNTFDELSKSPVKLKFIKTNGHEVLILLFRYNTTASADPICGVYFDSALLSLAPLTVVEDTILS